MHVYFTKHNRILFDLKSKFCYFFYTCIFSLSLVACNKEEKRQQAIQSRITERVALFKEKKTKECSTKALETAIHRADSILLQNADLWRINNDLIPRPPIPAKPNSPKLKAPIDSTPVVPLFPIKRKS